MVRPGLARIGKVRQGTRFGAVRTGGVWHGKARNMAGRFPEWFGLVGQGSAWIEGGTAVRVQDGRGTVWHGTRLGMARLGRVRIGKSRSGVRRLIRTLISK